jgi:hypothetical protein
MARQTIRVFARSVLRYVLVALAGTYVLSLLSLGIGLLVALAVRAVSGASGLSAAILFAGVALVATAVVLMLARRFIPASFLTAPPKAESNLEGSAQTALDIERAEVARKEQEEAKRWIRSAARMIAAEIARNRKLVQESPDGKWGKESPFLSSEAWSDRLETIACAESGRWAFTVATDAYREFDRLNRIWGEGWPRYDAGLAAVVKAAQTAEGVLAN